MPLLAYWTAEAWRVDGQGDYCWEDKLNEEIWSRSAAVQRMIQRPEDLCEEGHFGAQQAMVDGLSVLPWPPDLLGCEWFGPESLLIVGSAYAGFITEFSRRGSSMVLCEYDARLRWQEFQERFLRHVVVNDRSYYGGLACLLANLLPPKRIGMLDLCRASFVRRRRLMLGKGDEQGDVRAVRSGRSVYWRHVEDPACTEPGEWIWRRVTSSQASSVVVLGSIAEHGFLRLVQRRGLAIEVVGEGSVQISTQLNNGEWVAKYALDCIQSTSNPGIPRRFRELRMKYWLENGGRWYCVSGCVDGMERKWRVLPIYHPAVQNDSRCDPQYRSTIPVLKRILASAF